MLVFLTITDREVYSRTIMCIAVYCHAIIVVVHFKTLLTHAFVLSILVIEDFNARTASVYHFFKVWEFGFKKHVKFSFGSMNYIFVKCGCNDGKRGDNSCQCCIKKMVC